MLRQLATDLWIADRPQGFYGLEVGTRMTVIRLSDGSLLLHSPVALDPALRGELDALGPVRNVVAPNRFHHLYAGEATQACSGAALWVSPGLDRKRPDLVIAGVLEDEAPPAWKGQVDSSSSAAAPSRTRSSSCTGRAAR